MDKILTGSCEFFGTENLHDKDYLVFDQNQTEIFKYYKENGDCYFSYKPVSKQEYFDWHLKENNWFLNTAPLITKQFLEQMKIDIFREDKEIVFKIMHKMFSFIYQNVPVKNWNRFAYRMYIYCCFINNGNFDLSKEQLDIALAMKQGKPVSKEIYVMIYKFFGTEYKERDYA